MKKTLILVGGEAALIFVMSYLISVKYNNDVFFELLIGCVCINFGVMICAIGLVRQFVKSGSIFHSNYLNIDLSNEAKRKTNLLDIFPFVCYLGGMLALCGFGILGFSIFSSLVKVIK